MFFTPISRVPQNFVPGIIAFLQGDPLEQNKSCIPVRELAEAPGIPHGMPARVRKGIYGLLNGPKLWNNHILNQLKKDDSVLCLLDSCTGKFYDWPQEERHGGPKLVGLRPFNIDDFLLDGEDHLQSGRPPRQVCRTLGSGRPGERTS